MAPGSSGASKLAASFRYCHLAVGINTTWRRAVRNVFRAYFDYRITTLQSVVVATSYEAASLGQ